MKATEKSPAIEALLSSLTGRDRRSCVEQQICATCGEAVTEFRDDLSRREFQISGMCQHCQDEIFGI